MRHVVLTLTWLGCCSLSALAQQPPAAPPEDAIPSDPAPVVVPADPAAPPVVEAPPAIETLPDVAPPAVVAPPAGRVVVDDLAPAADRPALGVRFMKGTSVRLVQVLDDSPADEAGLRPGDQIVAVGNEAVSSSDEFIALVAASEGAVEVSFIRANDRHTILIDAGEWSQVFTDVPPYTVGYLGVAHDDDDDDDAHEHHHHAHGHHGHHGHHPVATVPNVWGVPAAVGVGPYLPVNVSPVLVPPAWYLPYGYPAYYGYYPYWGSWYYYSYYAPWYYYGTPYSPYTGYWPHAYVPRPAYWAYPVNPGPAHGDDDDEEDEEEMDSAGAPSDDTVAVTVD